MVIVAAAMFFGFLGAWFMSRFAYQLGLVDIPNSRSSHVLPTPRGGGVGILAAFLITSVSLQAPWYTWVPATLLAAVSLFDDRLSLTPRTRLLCQFVAAAAVAAGQGYSHHQPWLTVILMTVPVMIYLAGTANFYNFMDGINGIAAMTGVVAFALLAYISFLDGQQKLAAQLLALSAASLGFLPFNVPVARVFMGDVGSILLGFTFASATYFLSRTPADFLMLAGCLFPFYADTLSTLYLRWRAGEKLSQAHRRHLYQIIANGAGVTHWKVSLGYALLQLSVGAICVQIHSQPLILAAFLACCGIVWCRCMIVIRTRYESPAN